MNVAIILSGGIGTRMSTNIPKQYIEIKGNPVVYYCLKTFVHHPLIDVIIIGCAQEWRDYIKQQLYKMKSSIPVYYSMPGETRQYSIYNALKEAKSQGYADTDIVIIHDAARPLVSESLITDCLKGCDEADGIMPVIPVKDTLYQSMDGTAISSLLNRNELFAGQAPEAFRLGAYLALHDAMSHEELLRINGSTEIAYKGGLNVKMIRGDEMNFKITTPEDLSNFKSILVQKGFE